MQGFPDHASLQDGATFDLNSTAARRYVKSLLKYERITPTPVAYTCVRAHNTPATRAITTAVAQRGSRLDRRIC